MPNPQGVVRGTLAGICHTITLVTSTRGQDNIRKGMDKGQRPLSQQVQREEEIETGRMLRICPLLRKNERLHGLLTIVSSMLMLG